MGTVIMSNATWLKCSLMAVCSDKKYNSYRSANLFFFFLWNKLWKKTLNFGSFTWEIKEPSLYWNNSWLQHPLWSNRSAVFELLIVQFRLAFSEDFQVFHLEEMPLAPFSLFFFFCQGASSSSTNTNILHSGLKVFLISSLSSENNFTTCRRKYHQ